MMRHRYGHAVGLAALAMTVMLVGAGVTRADEAADVARRIEQAVDKLHTLREQRAAAAERHRDATAGLDRQIDRLRQDVDRVRSQVEVAREDVADLDARLADMQVRTAAVKSRIDRVVEAVGSRTEQTRQRIADGVPFDRETRLARADDAIAKLADDDRVDRATAIAGYYALLGDELKIANTIALWNDEVLLDGGSRKVNAYHVRLGMVTQAFVSEDRDTLGLYDADAANGWDTSLDAPLTESLLTVLQIMQAQRPPQVVTVPMSTAKGGTE